MSVTLLKDVLIDRGEIDRYFAGTVPVTLWRALKRASPGGVFDFVEQVFLLSNGKPRPADITIEEHQGVRWVRVTNRPRGVSTFDKPGVPPGKGWDYFRIPAGTVLPDGLAIVRDELNTKYGATHYTIAPAHDMPLEQFRFLLEQLAKNVIKVAI
jgi:hypothetical protein